MYKQFYSKLLLLVAMIVAGAGNISAAEVEVASATFNGKDATYTEGWTTTGTGTGRTDCIIIGSGENITSPAFDLSQYTKVTISIKARRYGTLTGSKATIDVAIGENSVGTTDATGTNATNSLEDIEFVPTANMTEASLVFTCTNATSAGSTHGAGINSIVITGTTSSTDPEISAEDVLLTYDATSGEIAYSVTNPVDGVSLQATTDANWISNINVASDKVTFSTTANEGNADRTGNITLSYTGAQDKVVTVTQGHLAADHVVLPYSWEGGGKDALNAEDGVTTSGLGNDYSSGNAPYLVKFDGDGDFIQFKTDSRPGKVTIGVKMLGGATTSKITVQGSSDGTTFTDVEELTISGKQNDVLTLETTNAFALTDRYVKLVFTKGSNVGVGPITIEKGSEKAAAGISFAETSYEANIGEEFTAPELTNPNQLEVTYASSNTDVATVDETSGEVTIVAAGQTTITATFAGNDEYEAGTASYTLTVVDPNAPGTANNPYNVEDAIAYINTLGTSSSPTEVYVKGIVSQVDSYNERYSSITYWISDDGETTTQMEVYSGKGLNSADFASKDDIQVGDEVTVCGTVKLYNQTPEFDYNNYLVSFNRPVVPEATYYLAGSWDGKTSWGADGMLEMTKNGDGTYSVSKEFTAEYTEFKIYKKDVDESETWYGGATNDENPYRIHRDWNTAPLSGENTAKNFIINEAGNYTFTVDVDALTLTVTGFPAQEFFLAGSFNNWATDATQFEIGTTENVYTLTQELEAGAKFKVVSEGKYYGTNETISAENYTDLALSEGTNDMTIATAGTYTFMLTKTQNGLFLTIGGFPEPVVKYFLAGSWDNGNGWTADGMVELNDQKDGSFINTINNFDANTEFKIVKDVNGAKTWYGGIPLEEGGEFAFINKDWCTDIVLKNDTEVDGSYKNFKIEKAGDYTFKVTDEGEDGLFLDVAGWKVNYALVTEARQLEKGKDIILVGENNGTLYAMAAQKENNRAAEVVTKEKGIITVDHSGSIPFITLDCIEGEAGTLWGFDTDDGYLCSASSDKNYLRLLTSSLMSFTDHPNAQATIEIAEDGQATIVFQGEYSRNDLRFNYNKSGDPLFSCYVSTSDMPHAYIYMETELDEIPLEVTITDAEWATYVAEDDVTFPEGVTAYVPTTISTTSVGLTQVSQAMKGEAVIVNGAAGTYQLAYAEEAISEKNAGNQFEISDGTVSDGSQYVLSNKNQGIVGFYKVKAGVTIPTGKPYLVIENAAKEFVPFAGGEATGIETIANEQWTIGDAYDLQGRKVQKLSKGIFIQNGRKIVVK